VQQDQTVNLKSGPQIDNEAEGIKGID